LEKEQAKKRIVEVTAILKNASEQYYKHGNSELSDAQYDNLEKELKILEQQFSELKQENSPTENINDGIDQDFKITTHKTSMLSLKNLYSKEELEKWYQNISQKTPTPKIYCDLKVDGMAISLFYKKGDFATAITRGDGQIGEDLTRNIKQILSLPKKTSYKQDFEIRGEIFFPKTEFDKFNTERLKKNEPAYKNPRNATVGTVRMKNADISDRGLQIFIYDMLSGAFSHQHHQNLLQLKKLGFLSFENYCLSSDLDEIYAFHQKIMEKREHFPFQIDGIVCRVDDNNSRELLGSDSKSPKWAVALKFQSEQAESKLRYVENSVGRSGVITPVAWLEAVELLGTRVQKASLYNYQQIKKLNICDGDTLLIEKGGDIIPKVVAVNFSKRAANASPILIPEHCPQCGSKLSFSDTKIDLYCNNKSCPAIILGQLAHYVSKKGMDIETLGISTIKKFLEKGWLQQIPDIYFLQSKQEEIANLEGFGEKSLQNLFSNIEQSKAKGLDKLIYAVGIPHIGENFSKQLAAASKNIDGLVNMERKVLEKLENFGEIVTCEVLQWIKQNKDLLLELKSQGLARQNYEAQTTSLGNVVITGTLSLSREVWKEKLEKKGFKVSAQVTQKTTILLAASRQEKGSKLVKARKLGIEIMEEEELKKKFQISTE
jgi:DNA ligase (NAD+)